MDFRNPGHRDRRKTVTVLFADVADFTSLGESVDPETVRATMSRYFEAMRAAIESEGGTIEKFVGDEVMAVFGVPIAREDDALRAVRAAADMHRALAELSEEFEREGGSRLQMRIGINTGTVVAGDASAGHAFVTGDAVNVGKRLEQAADPGEVLLGSQTFALVREAVEAEPVGPLAVKGKTDPVRAFRLLGLIEGVPGFARHFEAPLVGRAEELERLRAAFHRAVEERRCSIATVIGEAGIGKTRLVNELVAGLGDRAEVLVGRCVAYGNGATFLPIEEIVSQATRLDSGTSGEVRRALESNASTDEIFWAFRRLLEAIARHRPLVVLLEDVHWAEPTLLDLIEYLVGWITDASILIVCLARPELLDKRPALVSKPGTAIALAALAEQDAEALLANLQRDLPEETRSSIVKTAEGNPLYLEQLLAYVAEAGSAEGEAMPATIEALLAARLDQLEPEERAALDRAAVVGREFWRGAVLHLSPPGARDGIVGALMSLVRSELVHPDRSLLPGEDAFRFHHVLIRDAAYRGIPKSVRSQLHERCADWLAQQAGENDDLVGYHLEQAYQLRIELRPADETARELAARAGERLAAAGERARDRGDVPASRNLLERAQRLLPEGHPAGSEVVASLARVLFAAGEFEEAMAMVAGAIDRAGLAGDRRAEMLSRLQLAWMIQDLCGTDYEPEDSLAIARQAVAVFEEHEDRRGLAMAWMLMGAGYSNICQMALAADALVRANNYARDAGLLFEESVTSSNLGVASLWGPEPLENQISRLQQELTSQAERPGMQSSTLLRLAGAESLCGQFDEAREHCRRAEAIRQSLGQTYGVVAANHWKGTIEMHAGDLGAAEVALRHAYREYERLGAGQRQPAAAHIGEVLYRQGRYREAERFAEISQECSPANDLAGQFASRALRAKLLARRGQLDAAVALASQASALAAQTDMPISRGDVLMDLAEVMRLAGREDESAEAVEQALVLYEQKGATVLAERARAFLAAAPARR